MKVRARIIATIAVAATVAPLSTLNAQTSTAVSPSRTMGYRAEKPARVELFLGYSRFAAATSPTTGTAGNRMVGLNGGSAALALNLNRYLGLVGDFGGYANNQLQLTGTGANQPRTVDANGTAYTYLFGPRLSYRNESRFTPFVQVLAGGIHASPVTATNCSGPSCTPLPAQNAFAMTAGGGFDIRLVRHISLRPVQAEYMMTRFASIADGTKSGQNDLRLSSGLVFSLGGGQPMEPVQLACSATPDPAFPGDKITVTATATNLNPKHPAAYHWTSNAGTVSGTDTSAEIDTTAVAPGTYTVTGNVSQGNHPRQQASCTASFTVRAFDPPSISCSASPTSLTPGDSATITALATSPQHHALTYAYTSTAGSVTGSNASAVLSTVGVPPGSVTVTCNAVDDLGKSASTTTNVTVLAPPAVTTAAPEVRNLCKLSFERDHKRPVRVDNEAKACLDDIALLLQRESSGRLVILGSYAGDESASRGGERGWNARQYLVQEKGVDAQRIEVRNASGSDRSATDIFIPVGATYQANDSVVVDLTNTPPAKIQRKHRR